MAFNESSEGETNAAAAADALFGTPPTMSSHELRRLQSGRSMGRKGRREDRHDAVGGRKGRQASRAATSVKNEKQRKAARAFKELDTTLQVLGIDGGSKAGTRITASVHAPTQPDEAAMGAAAQQGRGFMRQGSDAYLSDASMSSTASSRRRRRMRRSTFPPQVDELRPSPSRSESGAAEHRPASAADAWGPALGGAALQALGPWQQNYSQHWQQRQRVMARAVSTPQLPMQRADGDARASSGDLRSRLRSQGELGKLQSQREEWHAHLDDVLEGQLGADDLDAIISHARSKADELNEQLIEWQQLQVEPNWQGRQQLLEWLDIGMSDARQIIKVLKRHKEPLMASGRESEYRDIVWGVIPNFGRLACLTAASVADGLHAAGAGVSDTRMALLAAQHTVGQLVRLMQRISMSQSLENNAEGNAPDAVRRKLGDAASQLVSAALAATGRLQEAVLSPAVLSRGGLCAHETNARARQLQASWGEVEQLIKLVSKHWPQLQQALHMQQCQLLLRAAHQADAMQASVDGADGNGSEAERQDGSMTSGVWGRNSSAPATDSSVMPTVGDEDLQAQAWLPTVLASLLDGAEKASVDLLAQSGVAEFNGELYEVDAVDEAAERMVEELSDAFYQLAVTGTHRVAHMCKAPQLLACWALELLEEQASNAILFVRDLDRSTLGQTDPGLEHFDKLRNVTDDLVNSILRLRQLLKRRRQDTVEPPRPLVRPPAMQQHRANGVDGPSQAGWSGSNSTPGQQPGARRAAVAKRPSQLTASLAMGSGGRRRDADADWQQASPSGAALQQPQAGQAPTTFAAAAAAEANGRPPLQGQGRSRVAAAAQQGDSRTAPARRQPGHSATVPVQSQPAAWAAAKGSRSPFHTVQQQALAAASAREAITQTEELQPQRDASPQASSPSAQQQQGRTHHHGHHRRHRGGRDRHRADAAEQAADRPFGHQVAAASPGQWQQPQQPAQPAGMSAPAQPAPAAQSPGERLQSSTPAAPPPLPPPQQQQQPVQRRVLVLPSPMAALEMQEAVLPVSPAVPLATNPPQQHQQQHQTPAAPPRGLVLASPAAAAAAQAGGQQPTPALAPWPAHSPVAEEQRQQAPVRKAYKDVLSATLPSAPGSAEQQQEAKGRLPPPQQRPLRPPRLMAEPTSDSTTVSDVTVLAEGQRTAEQQQWGPPLAGLVEGLPAGLERLPAPQRMDSAAESMPDSTTSGMQSCASSAEPAPSRTDSGFSLLWEEDPFWQLRWDSIKDSLTRKLGRGSSGQVFEAYYHGTVIAVKIMQVDEETGITQRALLAFKKQVDLQRHLNNHPHVVRFLGACCQIPRSLVHEAQGCPQAPCQDLTNVTLAILMELCRFGSFFKVISMARQVASLPPEVHSPDHRPTDAEAKLKASPGWKLWGSWVVRLQLAQQACTAVGYMHYHGIVHRDLTSSNLLITDKWEAKVADFDLSRTLRATDVVPNSGTINSPEWSAPERLQGRKYGKAADVFSFGVILWELLTLAVPWKEEATSDCSDEDEGYRDPIFHVMTAVPQGKRLRLPASVHPPLPELDQVTQVIRECWADDPAQRPAMTCVSKRLSDILDAVKQRQRQRRAGPA